MQTGFQFAKQAGTSTDEIAAAAVKASDEALLDVFKAARKLQARTTEAAKQMQVAEVVNVIQKVIEQRGLPVPAVTAAVKTAADDFDYPASGLLYALWIKFRDWLIGHNGYSDYYDGAFASLKPRKEGTVDHQTFAQREAALLQAMASAPTLDRQKELAHDLVTLRHERTAAAQADRDLDLANAVVRDTMTPVVTASRHTIATDWLGQDDAVDGDEITRTMAAAASRFYMGTSDEVRADGEEFEIQATGMASAVAGQYGEQAPVAVDAFVRHALFLNREPGVTAQPRTAGLGSNPGVTPLVTKAAVESGEDDDEKKDDAFGGKKAPPFGSKDAKTAADADINPYPANEQAGYAETGLPPTAPTEGYDEKGVAGDYGQEIAPENKDAVAQEGQHTPMPGAGESVPGVTSNAVKAQGAVKTASNPVKGIAIYPDKRVEEVTISGLSDGQAIVGGLIEPVTLKDGSTMYVNEEYLYSFGPEDVNWIASDVCGLGGRPEFMLRQPILGPVYVVGPVDGEGYDTDITDTARNWVNRVKREASIKPTASALDVGMRSPTLGFATSILSEAARSDYEHHNEDADRIWWEEEGRHGSEAPYCDVCGGEHSGPCPLDDFEASRKTAAEGARPIHEIAREIRSDWKNVYFGAVPYLDAMGDLNSITDRYGADDAKMILTYFISNASTWRGETAKRVKAEIKAMLGRKATKVAADGQTCTQCGSSIERDPEGESNRTWHHSDGSSHDHEAKPSGGSTASRRRTAKVDLTNVSFDGGIPSDGQPGVGKGTDSSGKVVRFNLSAADAKSLRQIMLSDLAINFSGITVDEADIITTAKMAGTNPGDQDGGANSSLPMANKDTTVAWPWELPEGDVETGQGAANVAGVPTPGGESGYPQPKKTSAVAVVAHPDRLAAFRAAVQPK